jgi:hypothetical protein
MSPGLATRSRRNQGSANLILAALLYSARLYRVRVRAPEWDGQTLVTTP